MESSFQVEFRASYQRNRNSRSKTKNLRCFPQCCANGRHVSNGFCGQSVAVVIDTASFKTFNALVAYAKFGIHGKKEEDMPRKILQRAELRSEGNSCCTWINTEISLQSSGRARVTINPDLLGWHYGWRSNKNTRNIKHSLKLFVFDCHDGENLSLLTEVESVGFVMYSGTSHDKNGASKGIGKRVASEVVAPIEDLSVLSKQKMQVPPESTGEPQQEPKQTIRELLVRAFLKFKLDAKAQFEKQHLQEPSRVNLEMGERQNSFMEAMEEYESIKFVEDLLNEDDVLLGIDETTFLSEDAHNSKAIDDNVLAQVLDSMTSTSLTNEVAAFLDECSKGPIGSSLIEILTKQNNLDIENPFLREFTKTVFCRFQRIIAKRIESDLFNKGYIQTQTLSSTVRGTTESTLKEFEGRHENDGLVFDPQDGEVLRRFLKLLCTYNRSPDVPRKIRMMKEADPGNRFLICNRYWKLDDQTPSWFEHVMCTKQGLVPLPIARVMARFEKEHHRYADEGYVVMKGKGSLAFNGCMTLFADGNIHEHEAPTPLFNFIEAPTRRYIATQSFEPDGSYLHKVAMFGVSPTGDVWFVGYSTSRVNASDPNKMHNTRLVGIYENPISDEDMRDVLKNAKPPEGAIQELDEYKFTFTAAD